MCLRQRKLTIQTPDGEPGVYGITNFLAVQIQSFYRAICKAIAKAAFPWVKFEFSVCSGATGARLLVSRGLAQDAAPIGTLQDRASRLRPARLKSQSQDTTRIYFSL